MAEQQQFYLLLGNLMSPDNSVRKQAEVRAGLVGGGRSERRRGSMAPLPRLSSPAVGGSGAVGVSEKLTAR